MASETDIPAINSATQIAEKAFIFSDTNPDAFQKSVLETTPDKYPCGNCKNFRGSRCAEGYDHKIAIRNAHCGELKLNF